MYETSHQSESIMPIVVAIAMAVSGLSSFLVLPVLVGSWTEFSGFSETEAGWLASADISGMVLSSIAISLLMNKFKTINLAYAGIAIALVGNVFSLYIDQLSLLLIARVLSGIGNGVIYALGLAALSSSLKPDRNFSILMFCQVVFGIVLINVFQFLIDMFGIASVYVGMSAISVFIAILIPFLKQETHVVDAVQKGCEKIKPTILPWLCLCSFFIFYLAVGSYWAYIELIGTGAGLSEGFITGSISYTQLISLPSCVLAGLLSIKYGQTWPLIISLLLGAGAFSLLGSTVTNLTYALSMLVFFFVWSPIDIYQFSFMSKVDHTGRFVALVPAFQGTGNALGPLLASFLLTDGEKYSGPLIGGSILLFSTAVIYFYANTILRKTSLTDSANQAV